MRSASLLASLILLLSTAALGDDLVETAIAVFEKHWRPASDALDGAVVAVALPELKGGADDERLAHDQLVLEAGYLSQLCKLAGARLVARPDDPDTDEHLEITCLFLNHPEGSPGPFWDSVVHRSKASTTSPGSAVELRRHARSRAVSRVRQLIAEAKRRTLVKEPTTEPGDSNRTARLAESIWSTPPLPPERADWFCGLFARLAVSNASLTLFRPQAAVEDGKVILRGVTNAPSLARGLIAALAAVGVRDVRSEMRTLPEDSHLGELRFGACVAPMAITRTEPRESAGEQTELLYGEPVYLLDRTEGYYLLHAGDGYWGWVRYDAIHAMNAETFDEYTRHPRAIVGEPIALPTVTIPRGATVAVERGPDPEHLSVVLPGGSREPVAASAVRVATSAKAEAAKQRVRSALDRLYIPYRFGGRSPLGLDCSGLVGGVCLETGITPARDAWQLAFSGQLSATRWHRSGLRAGDFVFFIDERGKIYHTGVAISATHIVDASPPAVQIGSIVPGDRLYDARMDRDFFVAKRP